jgi:hypothetical protein
MLLVIMAGALIYVIFEYNSIRVKSGVENEVFSNYSLFSLEFLGQCKVALKNLYNLGKNINGVLLASMITIDSIALALLIINRKKDSNLPLVRTGIISLLCFASLVLACVIIAAKAQTSITSHASDVMSMYGIFFYYMLMTGLTLIYITNKINKSVLVLPFLLILLFVQTTNTNKPYLEQRNYGNELLTTWKKRELVNSWIEQVKCADERNVEQVTVEIPEWERKTWPLDTETTPVFFANCLYRHGITSRRMNIVFKFAASDILR